MWGSLVTVRLAVTLGVSANSARYIAQAVNSLLLPFLRQAVDVVFHQSNVVHIRLLRRNVLFVMCNNCPDKFNTYGT